MNIYVVHNLDDGSNALYNLIVVIEKNEERAKRTHPYSNEHKIYYNNKKKEFLVKEEDGEYKPEDLEIYGWTDDLTKLSVEYIGKATDGLKKCVVAKEFEVEW